MSKARRAHHEKHLEEFNLNEPLGKCSGVLILPMLFQSAKDMLIQNRNRRVICCPGREKGNSPNLEGDMLFK